MNGQTGNRLIDSMTVVGYDIPDPAVASSATSEGNKTTADYKIPLAVWMILFLVAGYIGLRMILED